MKKILLGTTAALALGTFAGEALAAEKIKLELGGFMRQYLAIKNHDETTATGTNTRGLGIGQWSNNEIYVSGSTTLDSGLTVKASFEIEAKGEDTGNHTDVVSLAISSDAMGTLTLGQVPHASDMKDVNAPNAGNFGWGDVDGELFKSAVSDTDTSDFSWDAYGDWNSDNETKIVYVSPSFSGVEVFASYTAAEDTNGANLNNGDSGNEEGASYGIAYSGDFDGVGVKADLSQTHWGGATDWTYNHFGVNVTVGGFTIGGGYIDGEDDGTGTAQDERTIWDLGIAYADGPYKVSASYMDAEFDDGGVTTDDSDTGWRLAGTYDLTGGVALTATYVNLDNDSDTSSATRVAGDGKVSGLIAGIEVSF